MATDGKRDRLEAANSPEEKDAKKLKVEGKVAAENVEQQPKAKDAVEAESEKIDGADEAERTAEDADAQKVDAGTEVADVQRKTVPVVNKEVQLGPKTFHTSSEMFNYFTDIVQYWPKKLDVNKYEFLVLMALLEKGHNDPKAKIGAGVTAFQVRTHPKYHSRCLYLVRGDGSVEDFSARKCIENLMGLPHNKPNGGKGKGRGGKGKGGRGRSDQAVAVIENAQSAV